MTNTEKRYIINVCISLQTRRCGNLNRVFESVKQARVKSRIDMTLHYIQHGDTSCLLHMIAVAYYSAKIADMLRLDKRKRKSLIIGALLHDYFLYDWHKERKGKHIHGFTHPAEALKNASEDFELNAVEADIIRKHMFPLTVIPPRYIESWIVCFVDKACSLYETFATGTYPEFRKFIREEYKEDIYKGDAALQDKH